MISAEDYLETWRREGGRARPDRPGDPTFRRYTTSIRAFVDERVYPAWWTDPDRERFVTHGDPLATPITFRLMLDYSALCQEILELRRLREGRRRLTPHVIVEHCAVTGVRVVKDGCKELLAFLVRGADHSLAVTEVSGADWSGSFIDMGRILAYRRRTGSDG